MKVALEYELAKRMRSATRWVEGQQGMLPDDGDGAVDGFGRAMLVRTGALPTPYTGAEGVAGTTIDQQPTGANVAGVAVLIKDLNGGKLAANTTYSARLGGFLTGMALYFVELGGGSIPASVGRLCEYRPTGGVNPRIAIVVHDVISGAPTALLYNPLGSFCDTLLYFKVLPRLIVCSPSSATVIPFTFWGRCAGYDATGAEDYARILPPITDQYTFIALDPCGFARSSYERYGKFPRVMISWTATVTSSAIAGSILGVPYAVIGAPSPQPMQTSYAPPVGYSVPPTTTSGTLGAPLGAPLGG